MRLVPRSLLKGAALGGLLLAAADASQAQQQIPRFPRQPDVLTFPAYGPKPYKHAVPYILTVNSDGVLYAASSAVGDTNVVNAVYRYDPRTDGATHQFTLLFDLTDRVYPHPNPANDPNGNRFAMASIRGLTTFGNQLFVTAVTPVATPYTSIFIISNDDTSKINRFPKYGANGFWQGGYGTHLNSPVMLPDSVLVSVWNPGSVARLRFTSFTVPFSQSRGDYVFDNGTDQPRAKSENLMRSLALVPGLSYRKTPAPIYGSLQGERVIRWNGGQFSLTNPDSLTKFKPSPLEFDILLSTSQPNGLTVSAGRELFVAHSETNYAAIYTLDGEDTGDTLRLAPAAASSASWVAVSGTGSAAVAYVGDQFAGTVSVFGGMKTAVGDGGAVRPRRFSLAPASPNPFNPTTEIRFTLAERSQVALRVYDLLGRTVATLADETLEAGAHARRFDAGSLASGVYLVQLTAPGFSQTRRVALVK